MFFINRRCDGALVFLPFLFAGSLLFTAGCGGGDGGDDGGGNGGGGTLTAEELTSQGWEAFETDSLDAARSSFGDALAVDSSWADAWTGIGWSRLAVDSVDGALTGFASALALDSAATDALAGKAAAYPVATPPSDGEAVAAAGGVLRTSPRYAFHHDSRFDWRDLRLIRAESFFALSEYDSANSEVDSLGGNRADPGSASFVSDLLAEIERLAGTIAD